MKKVLLSSVVALAASTGVAFAADTATQDITLKATQDEKCILGGMSINGTPSTTAADLDPTAAAIKITFTDSYCNFVHKVKLSSAKGGLAFDGTVPTTGTSGTTDPFDTHMNYTATLSNWTVHNNDGGTTNETSIELETAGSPKSVTKDGRGAVRNNGQTIEGDRWTGDEPLTLTIGQVTAPTALLAGDYTDTLTLAIGKNL